MIYRDFMLRVCWRNPCKMRHEVENCTNKFCNKNKFCKKVHLTDYEIDKVNKNIRPFRESVNNEMCRLAYILRESYSSHLQMHCCTLNMLGKCLWTCSACSTTFNNKSIPVCNKCYIKLKYGDIQALRCAHTYCQYCFDRLPCQVDGPLPVFYCKKCNKWTCILLLWLCLKTTLYHARVSFYLCSTLQNNKDRMTSVLECGFRTPVQIIK